MNERIEDIIPPGVECGVGLALQDDNGRYLFGLAGARYSHKRGELFYCGIGGHLEQGEDWVSCAHREAREEIGADIDILPSNETWHLPQHGVMRKVTVVDYPAPLALYEMSQGSHDLRAGEIYYMVIYWARLRSHPTTLSPDEISGIIALTKQQVILGRSRKPTLSDLISEGGSLINNVTSFNFQCRVYPIGTALVLSKCLDTDTTR